LLADAGQTGQDFFMVERIDASPYLVSHFSALDKARRETPDDLIPENEQGRETVRTLTGVAPLPLETFIHKNAQAFGGTAVAKGENQT
jgi:hypothetical protein